MRGFFVLFVFWCVTRYKEARFGGGWRCIGDMDRILRGK